MAPCATPVEDAARRLRRWPAAILDRRCARRPRVVQAGAEKRPPAEPRNGTAPGRSNQRDGPAAAWDTDLRPYVAVATGEIGLVLGG